MRKLGPAAILLLTAVWLPRAGPPPLAATPVTGHAADLVLTAGVTALGAPAAGEPTAFERKLRRTLWTFLLLSAVALVLLAAVALFLLWRAKKLVENAVRPNLPALAKLVATKRRKHPGIDDRTLARKLIRRQAARAGVVGFVTGLGGLPTLPVTLPIDIASTIRIQSSLVHLMRLVRGPSDGGEEIPETSLWLISTGGRELTAASSKMIQRLLVKYLSESVLKFLPLLGGVVGFALNWTSTQALGRLTLKWLDQRRPPQSNA